MLDSTTGHSYSLAKLTHKMSQLMKFILRMGTGRACLWSMKLAETLEAVVITIISIADALKTPAAPVSWVSSDKQQHLLRVIVMLAVSNYQGQCSHARFHSLQERTGAISFYRHETWDMEGWSRSRLSHATSLFLPSYIVHYGGNFHLIFSITEPETLMTWEWMCSTSPFCDSY